MAKVTIETPAIERILPHRLPMRLVDSVAIEVNVARGTLRQPIGPDGTDPIISQYDQARALAVAIETCAQTAAVYALQNEPDSTILFTCISDLTLDGHIDLREAAFVAKNFFGERKDNGATIEVWRGDRLLLNAVISCRIARKGALEALASRVKRQGSLSLEETLKDFRWFRNWSGIERTDNGIATISDIPDDTCFFRGHFPNTPVMSGVFILLGALKTIQEHRGIGLPKRIESFSFIYPILPHSRMITDVSYRGKGLYDVEVFANGISSAKGDLVYNQAQGGE